MKIKPEEPTPTTTSTVVTTTPATTATAAPSAHYTHTHTRAPATVFPPPPRAPRPPPFYAALKVSCRANIVGCVAIGIIALKSKMVSRYTLFVIKILRIYVQKLFRGLYKRRRGPASATRNTRSYTLPRPRWQARKRSYMRPFLLLFVRI